MAEIADLERGRLPMMLQRLDINGFRGLDDFSLRFSAASCIIGPASSGKSSIADAIRMLFHPGRGAGSLRLSEWDFSRSQSDNEELVFDITGLIGPILDLGSETPAELVDLFEFFESKDLSESSTPTNDSIRAVRIGLRGTWIPSEGNFSYEHHAPKFSDGDELRRISSPTREWLGVNVIGASRSFWGELAPHSHSSLHRLLMSTAADIPGAARDVADRLGELGLTLSQRSGFREGLDTLGSRIATTMGADSLELRLGAGLPSRLGALSRFSLVTGDGSPLELEGSGASSAAVLASLLEVGGVGIVIIDAPETALSSPLQRSLMSRLMNESDQTIVITHSPSIISLFDPEEIIILRGRKRPLILKDELAKVASRGQLLKFWRARPDFMACLTGTWALVVEGPSDLTVYSRVLEYLARSDDDSGTLLGMWMLDGSGTDGTHLIAFLESCGVRTCAVLDGDKKGAELKSFEKAASCVVTLPDGKSLEDLLLDCTDDVELKERIEALRQQKGNTLEHVEVTTEILETGDTSPFQSLFKGIAVAIRPPEQGTDDVSD